MNPSAKRAFSVGESHSIVIRPWSDRCPDRVDATWNLNRLDRCGVGRIGHLAARGLDLYGEFMPARGCRAGQCEALPLSRTSGRRHRHHGSVAQNRSADQVHRGRRVHVAAGIRPREDEAVATLLDEKVIHAFGNTNERGRGSPTLPHAATTSRSRMETRRTRIKGCSG